MVRTASATETANAYQEPCPPLAQAPSPDPATQLGVNLIVNGDAESGPGSPNDSQVIAAPGWNSNSNFTVVNYGGSGGLPAPSDPGPQDRGTNLFAGGPDNPSSAATQLIDVSPLGCSIDGGVVNFELSAYLGGFASQEDYAVLTATFRGTSGNVLSSATIGPVRSVDRGSATGLGFVQTSGSLPSGTRQIAVELMMTRDSGAYNDGYADNLSLVLSAP